MKTRILVTFFCTMGMLNVSAQKTQKFSYGITAGLSSGSVKITGIGEHFAGVVRGQNILGMEGGFYTKIKMNPLYIKPSVAIHYKCGTADMINAEGVAYTKADFKMTRLQVPILFGVNLSGPVSAEVGPIYNYVLGVTDQFSIYAADVPRNGLGYRAGVNVELDWVTLGVSYQAITNRFSTRGTFETPDEVMVSAAFTIASKGGMAPYGKK